MSKTDVRKIRAGLKHPIIDADGHWAEFHPHMRKEFKRIGGGLAVEAFDMATARIPKSLNMSVAERRHRRIGQEAFWFLPTKNTLDRATAMMPRLLYERLDEIGLDFCVIYPTSALGWYRLPSEKHRRALVRAYNTFTADQFRPYSDRIIPAAIIPMYSPEEAVEELEHVSKQLGLRVCMTGSLIRRPIPALEQEHPEAVKFVEWYDTIGIDSIHDYDPVWAKFRELKIAPSFHQSARSILLRNSPSNFCYNHIGHFASASEATAKALFFGGVTRRFPELNFGFLEGGVGWACSLYADLIGHWEKRNPEGLENTNPARLDRAGILALAEKYAKPEVLEAVRQGEGLDDNGDGTGGVEHLDDYWRCKITRKEDFTDLYVNRYYFGCEADDPINAWAFNRKALPMGARLNAFFSSDIGHFDVPDMTKVVPEAYELVEHGLLDDDDFRDFTFANAVRFWGEVNPDFFKGTAVEREATEVLGKSKPPSSLRRPAGAGTHPAAAT
jgi:predicted TIM-barrel fold metal-dependent hydrolase